MIRRRVPRGTEPSEPDEEPYNRAFRATVTDVAFNLTLSRGMVANLVALDVAHQHGGEDRPMAFGTPWSRSITSHWVQSATGLRRRGLIDPPADEGHMYPGITTAGQHVIALLKEAGIYQEIAATLRFDKGIRSA